MNLDVFPAEYDREVDSRAKEMISQATNESENKIEEKRFLQKELEKKFLQNVDGVASDYSWTLGSSLFGGIGGFFVCCHICVHGGDFDSAILSWMTLAVTTAICGTCIDSHIAKKKKQEVSVKNQMISKKNQEVEQQIEEVEQQIENEKVRTKRKIDKINASAELEKQKYKASFERRVQDMSVKYASSELAKQVIKWMTDGFCKTIDAADRSSHIQNISVPFDFHVYCNSITCNLGTYDFIVHRCQSLNTAIEQAALARAVATAMQLNITMKYLEDKSGTKNKVTIEYMFSANATVVLRYSAVNGYYKAVQNW